MSYIGNDNITQGFIPAIDYFSGNGSTVAFTLSRPVASVAQVQANISNVPQNPSSAFSVSGNTITFTSAPPSGTNNIYVYYTSPITQVIAPSQGTVNTTSLGNITNIASGNSSLTLQTGSTPTTALTIDTSQNVGIGTAVAGAISPSLRLGNAGSGGGVVTATFSLGSYSTGYGSNIISSSDFSTSSASYLAFGTTSTGASGLSAPVERMRIDSSGNVGIGIAPTFKFDVWGPIQTNGDAYRNSAIVSTDTATAGYGGGIAFGGYYNGTSSYVYDFAGIQGFKENSTAGNYAGALRFTTRANGGNPTERARIDSSGILGVGTTGGSTGNNTNSFSAIPAAGGGYILVQHASGSASGFPYAYFSYNTTVIGSISQNGTTAVAYNTTSDYRLKENVQPLAGALSRIAALKPCTYTWKSAPDEIGEGFIAHELAEVCPQAVTGEKDALNEDGSIKPQSIDTSFLVATLTAAIQEQQALIQTLTDRITALEGAK